ncbi:MAG TPA: DUF3810 family protein [Vicinamibacterales bacterium]|nr:DUF3810 family protein [Vicinamibacterales bacterium]
MRPFVETAYSTRIYPAIQAVLTRASNLTPFAWLDVLLVIVPAAFLILAARDVRRRGWMRGVFAAILRALVWAVALALVFLAVWGLNYQRLPMAERVRYDAAAVTPGAVHAAAAAAAGQANALYADAHAAGWAETQAVDAPLAAGLARALADLRLPSAIVVGRPKRTLLDAYFRRAGVSGMTDPIFLETLVSSDLLPFERPFVVAHEWGHLAGIADEGDANFVGWLACVRGSTPDRYSGWLFLYGELAAALRGADRADAVARLDPGPRDDLRAVSDRVSRHVNRRVAAAGWRVYDSYLKANRVEAGAASYAQVVRLVAGTPFDDQWRPALRP